MQSLRTAFIRPKRPACLPICIRSAPRLSAPLSLCARTSSRVPSSRRYLSAYPFLRQNTQAQNSHDVPPPHCPGCGAPSQRTDEALAGYYPVNYKKKTPKQPSAIELEGDKVWQETLSRLGSDKDVPIEVLRELAGKAPDAPATISPKRTKRERPPLCNRCHEINHYDRAPLLPSYPTLKTLCNLLSASPHSHNHIYHLIDAADMPMTLQPQLMSYMHANLDKRIFRNLTISYVVTRCDLLVHKREMLSGLESRIKSIIKSALPPNAKLESVGPFRESNGMHFTSSRLGWGIGKLKSEAIARKGGVWFFGGVNTGKSSLIRDVWPSGGHLKGITEDDAKEFDLIPNEESVEEISDEAWGELSHRMENRSSDAEMENRSPDAEMENRSPDAEMENRSLDAEMDTLLTQRVQREKEAKLLPRSHVPPTVSYIPGTTAAPLRIIYKELVGRKVKKSTELVDLPGIERWVGQGDGGLMKYVLPERRKDLYKASRDRHQMTLISKQQSMSLGGLFMFEPKELTMGARDVMIANRFTPLEAHAARTNKCIRYFSCTPRDAPSQLKNIFVHKADALGEFPPPVKRPANFDTMRENEDTECFQPLITTETRKENFEYFLPSAIKSAGVFKLSEDVTARRNPMLEETSPEALAELPYKIYGTEIVIDGVGFVELSCQVRRDKETGECLIPEVEVFSPEGKGIMQRKCLNLYMHLQKTARGLAEVKKTRRKAMKGDKKRAKLEARERK